jgi:hypothetical protein
MKYEDPFKQHDSDIQRFQRQRDLDLQKQKYKMPFPVGNQIYSPPYSDVQTNPGVGAAIPAWGVGSVSTLPQVPQQQGNSPMMPNSIGGGIQSGQGVQGVQTQQPAVPSSSPVQPIQGASTNGKNSFAVARQNVTPTPAEPTPPEVTPFLTTMYQSIRNVDPEQRGEYLQSTMASIKERMDRYEFRIARGIPLTAEQQTQYNSIRSAYNDINRYINNQSAYDQLFGQWNANMEQVRTSNPNAF